MAITFPYIINDSLAYEGDKITNNLSLAISLKDDYTNAAPAGNIKVIINEGEIKANKNLTGFYIFNDIPPGSYNILIESEFYFTEEKLVNLPLPDPKNPLVEISLTQKPSYPFAANATLIRGIVTNGDPVAGADITVISKSIKTRTNDRGEFVLFFKGIAQENITIEIKKNSDTKSVNATIKEGKTVSLGIISFP